MPPYLFEEESFMAVNTPLRVRNLSIYNVVVRNFTEAGTLNAIHSELDRIKSLGTDYIWFLSFYEIGEKNKKGTLGSPFAIKNHRKIDPNLGTIEDFKILIREIHKRNMKVIVDIVFDHTSPDSLLVKENPEWFFKKLDGSMGNRFGDWKDIVDLDYNKRDLWDYQIETLKYWAQHVDGFRCNAAPLIPVEFWLKAREEVSKVKPDLLWIADSVETRNIQHMRSFQIGVHSDAELYQAFDLSFDFDIRDDFHDYLRSWIPLSKLVDSLNKQDTNFPWNYAKLRFLENYDQERIINLLTNIDQLIQWTAFSYLQKGASLLFNGQEVAANKMVELFEDETINWETGINLSQYLARLAHIQKEFIPLINVHYHLEARDDINTVVMYYNDNVENRIGVFNLKHHEGDIHLDIPDGEYTNEINLNTFLITDGKMNLKDTPAFFITH